MNKIQQTI